VSAIRNLGLSGFDLQGISDHDLKEEMKISSAILRRRILRNLQQLTQETANAFVKDDDFNDTSQLHKEDIAKLAKQVQILQTCKFEAIDRIFVLNCPSQFGVKWYPTNIRQGLHKVTVIDRNTLKNSSSWFMRYDMPCYGSATDSSSLSTYCLSANQNGLRWRLHNGSVELCINTVSDELNTDLVISVFTVGVPESPSCSVSDVPTPRRRQPVNHSFKLLSSLQSRPEI